jgi:hypothetical protein
MYQAYSGVSRIPEPAVTEKASQRKFSAEYKLRILTEAEASRERGLIGAPLPWAVNGLFPSHGQPVYLDP